MTTCIEGFSYSPIPDAIFEIMKGKSFKTDCTIPREELSYLRIRYVDLQGKTQDGEMVVNRRIAETVLSIFQELYAAKYPCLLYTSPSPRDVEESRMPSSA